MSDAAVCAAVSEDEAALATPFVKCLVRLIRAQEPRHGLSQSPRAVEARHVLQRRRACDCGAFPPGDVANCGGQTLEALGAGFSAPGVGSFCPEIHRFGFETFRQLAEAGTRLVDDATAATEASPEVALA
ncbi:DUF269 domain-containing protein [Mesorhizobium sp. J8]|uniref:DUF269 domain-containing protein n=1 Tax=Mesorhizobium sp. J8 TaxID=2777475 RepID=UPI003992C409